MTTQSHDTPDRLAYPHRGSWRHAKWCDVERGSETGCTCGLDTLRAALASEGGLDEAWAEVEAVLPEGSVLRVAGPTLTEGRHWVVGAYRLLDRHSETLAVEWNDEFGAALRALAARLATPTEEPS